MYLHGLRGYKLLTELLFFKDENDPWPDFARIALKFILGQVADTPRFPMKGLPGTTNAATLNQGR